MSLLVNSRHVGVALLAMFGLIAVGGCGGPTSATPSAKVALAAGQGTGEQGTGEQGTGEQGTGEQGQPAEKQRPGGDKAPPAKEPLEAPAPGEGRVAKKEIPDPFPRAGKAPKLDGGIEWLNTGGKLKLKDLKGKWVLLDFWTYCCINCIHILPELKKLEKAHPNDLVVIGVHSAKFDTEKGSKNIRQAIRRYEIIHPVVNDANHAIWDNFGVSSWPSLRLIDPEGRLVAGHSGEIDAETLEGFLKKFTPYYKQQGVLDPTPLRFKLESAEPTPLRFPGKVLADEAGKRLFITDSNHNRIVITRLDGTLLEIIGNGQIGKADGDYKTATFDHPQGVALRRDPTGEVLYVADTENHLLRKVDLTKKQVTTIAGTGEQRRGLWPGIKFDKDGVPDLPDRFVGKPKEEALNSPWALWVQGKNLYIAMAGPHQIWKMTLDEKEIGIYAGNGREDIVDGPLVPKFPFQRGFSSFAQPSGLASDGTWLYVADSEGSTIRAVPFDPKKDARTLLNTARLPGGRLFTFGDVDGALNKALLQHCIGVAHYQGKLYVADSYNNKIKEIDIKKETIKTIAGNGKPGSSDEPAMLDEPAGLYAAAGKLFVADTNNNVIRVIDLNNKYKVATLKIAGLKPPVPPKDTSRPTFPGAKQIAVAKQTITAKDGKVTLAVELQMPEGWKISPDAPLSYLVEAEGKSGPIDRAAIGKLVRPDEAKAKFTIDLPANAASGKEKLKVSLAYFFCETKPSGLCKGGSVVWTVPVEIAVGSTESAIKLSHKVKASRLGEKLGGLEE